MARQTISVLTHPARILLSTMLALLLLAALPAAADQETGFTHGLLWQVSTRDVAPSYIFGTMHSADDDVATPSAALQAILDRVDSITIEVVLDRVAEVRLGTAMFYTDGRRLSEIAGADRFARVVEVGARYGLRSDRLELIKPWGVMALFSFPPAELRRQAGGAVMLDRVLQNRAHERGIPVHGIETVDEQIEAIGGASEADQLALLDATLDSSARIDRVFERLRRTYLAGDLAGLHRMTLEQTGSTPDDVVDRFLERIITGRNRRMAERIQPRLAEGNALIAVGALHLYGEEGVLGLLAAEGYELSRVE